MGKVIPTYFCGLSSRNPLFRHASTSVQCYIVHQPSIVLIIDLPESLNRNSSAHAAVELSQSQSTIHSVDLLECHLRKFLNGLNMFLWRLKATAHRVKRKVRGSDGLPLA